MNWKPIDDQAKDGRRVIIVFRERGSKVVDFARYEHGIGWLLDTVDCDEASVRPWAYAEIDDAPDEPQQREILVKREGQSPRSITVMVFESGLMDEDYATSGLYLHTTEGLSFYSHDSGNTWYQFESDLRAGKDVLAA